jgi:hypothetical protein
MRPSHSVLFLLLPALAALAAAPTPAPTPRIDAPILEFVCDGVAPTSDAAAMAGAAKGLDAAIARCDGHGATWRATAVDGDGITLRATRWNSIEAAEAAALRLDGDAAANAFATTTAAERRLRAHFRQLRTQTYQDTPCGHLEVVVFRTRPGVTREANLQKFDAAEADFAQGKGLLGHSLWLAPDGSWVHLLNWASADDYAQTGKALFGKPGVGGWIRSLDFQRFVVHRGDVVR